MTGLMAYPDLGSAKLLQEETNIVSYANIEYTEYAF